MSPVETAIGRVSKFFFFFDNLKIYKDGTPSQILTLFLVIKRKLRSTELFYVFLGLNVLISFKFKQINQLQKLNIIHLTCMIFMYIFSIFK